MIKKLSATAREYSLPLISGVALFLLFPPFGLHLLAWTALVPLLVSLDGGDPVSSFKKGLAAGIVYFGGVLPWIAHAMTEYGGISLPVSILLMGILIVYLAMQMAVFAWGLSRIGKSPETVLYAPFLFVLLEHVRTHLFTGFPWALLAHSQHAVPQTIQIASITGTAGVSFLIVAVNAGMAYSLIGWKREGAFKPAMPVLAICLAFFNFFWGQARMDDLKEMGGKPIKASLIQGNILQDQKWDPDRKAEILTKYIDLTRKEVEKKPELVVWPETAIPFYYGRDYPETDSLRNLAKETGIPLLFGGMGAEPDPQKKSYRYYNRAFIVTLEGEERHYDKIHLVPFGEYVPLRGLLFFVDKITDAVSSDITPGDSATPVKVNGASTGILICYEIIFPEPSRSFVRSGAVMLVNLTNDAWYGKSAASSQHLMSIPFRAVENGVPVLRAANTGISLFAEATGEMKRMTGLFETAAITDTVTIPNRANTFYTRYGDIFTYACAIMLIVAIANSAARGKTGRKGSPE